MKTRSMAAAVAVALVTVLSCLAAPSASAAASGSPLDCEGVVAVRGGYRLTEDTSCSLTWIGDDEFLDLRGHTLTGGFRPQGHNQTVRNGTLITGRSDWSMASDFSVSRVTVRSAPSSTWLGIAIEAGYNLRVDHSTFEGFPGLALDFYFGEGGTVRHSVFRGNRIAISIQQSSDVLIENSSFIDNSVGVNLWPEDEYGVDRNTVQKNVFRGNGYGITIRDDGPGFFPTGLQDNLIAKNLFQASGYSGISITRACSSGSTPSEVRCLGSGNVIRDNHLSGSGFQSPAEAPYDDGITARGSIGSTPHPAALVGFTLSGNRAVGNADLGFDVLGVTDGGRNSAKLNGNPAQCEGLLCRVPRGAARQALEPAPTLEPARATPEFRHQ
jgi:hypothetical protein